MKDLLLNGKWCYIFLVFISIVTLSILTLQLRESQTYQGLKETNKTYIRRFPSTRRNLNRTLTILLWTSLFGDPTWFQKNFSRTFSSCPVSDCVLTKNKSDIVRADALLFHDRDLSALPKYRRWDQVWIIQNAESPPHTYTFTPKYNGVFNWTATYRRNSDLRFPYFKTPKLSSSRSKVENIAATKTAGIAWAVSNCADKAKRQFVAKEIQKYIPVDIYGKCGGKPLPHDKTATVLKKYKFYLAFENSYCRDYITEKFPRALQRHNIPIIVVAVGHKTLAPPHSYIDISDFKSIKHFTDYLKYLDKNDTAYNSYFEWSRDMEVVTKNSNWCTLCKALHDEKRPVQVYTDLKEYVKDDCFQWSRSKTTFQRYKYT